MAYDDDSMDDDLERQYPAVSPRLVGADYAPVGVGSARSSYPAIPTGLGIDGAKPQKAAPSYPVVAVPSLDEQTLATSSYPPVRAGAGVAPRDDEIGTAYAPVNTATSFVRPSAPAPGLPPQISDNDYPPVIPSGSGGPNAERDAMTGTLAEPNRADYAPPVRHGFWGKLEDFAERSPIGQIAREEWGLPATRELAAEQRYKRDEADYDKLINRGTAAAKAEQDAEDAASKRNLERAQANEAEANADAKKNPQPKEGTTPEETAIHDLMTGGENGQPRINPDTGKPYNYLDAYTAVKKAGAAPAKQDEEGKAVSDWLSANNLADTAANRTKARSAIKEGSEPGSWSLQTVYDKDGPHTYQMNSKTRQMVPFEGGTKANPQDASAKLDQLQQQATTNIRQLDEAHQAGKVSDQSYVDQSIQQWKTYAQSVRRLGQVPTITQDLVNMYKAKYGPGKSAMQAAANDGWAFPGVQQ